MATHPNRTPTLSTSVPKQALRHPHSTASSHHDEPATDTKHQHDVATLDGVSDKSSRTSTRVRYMPGDVTDAFTGDPDETVSDGDDGVGSAVRRHDRDRPGHMVMDPAEIRKALRLSGFDGSYEALSSGEEQRVRTLVSYEKMDLWRPHLLGTPAMLSRLDDLAAEQPNFATATALVRQAATLSLVAGSALQVPPIVLVGNPGVGKSRFARALAEAIDTSFDVVNGATLPDSASLTGYPPVWRGAAPGRLAKFLVGAANSGPLVFIDECEKLADVDRMPHPLDRMLSLLETGTASRFMDENLAVPMRAQNAIFLFGCNALEPLSRPFLDRVVTIEVPDLTTAQRDGVLGTMLDEVSRELGLAMSFGRPDAVAPLRDLGLRRCRLALRLAVARAVEQQRRFLVAADLAAALALLGAPETRQSAGFIRHPLSGRERA